MGGGLMQLVAYGAQDIYLTGNPQITFFKVVYRRHTNFSMESIQSTFNGTVDFGKKANVTISRNGDLVGAMYLEIELPTLDADNSYVEGVGNAVIKSVEVEIGGQRIDKHYGEWLDIWGELNVDANHKTVYQSMVGNAGSEGAVSTRGTQKPERFYVPLRFWFNRNPGLALPLIALQYHEVKLNFEFEEASKMTTAAKTKTQLVPSAMTSCKLYTDYIYLDTDERRRFAQVSHEYLIEQLQHTGVESLTSGTTSNSIIFNFNHPVKSLHWVIQNDNYLTGSAVRDDDSRNTLGNQKLNYQIPDENTTTVDGRDDTFETAKLMLNGHDRAPPRNADYFRMVQNVEHMAAAPSKTIYTYSFALKASEHQPSGTCNFSRIDNATLRLTFTGSSTTGQAKGARTLKLYAVNYNVLRIMSGMGGLAYSN